MLNIDGFNHKVKIDNKILDLELSDKLGAELNLKEKNFIQSLPLGLSVITGVPGSGKTEILLKRAIYLARKNPSWKILILTYNKSLAYKLQQRIEDFRRKFKSGLNARDEKNSSRNLKNNLNSRYDFFENIEIRNFHSIASELAGIKKPDYIDTGDWFKELVVDVAMTNVKESYDAVFIDDYQDFRTSWIKLAVEICKSYSLNKNIFLVGDELQSIYEEESQSSYGGGLQSIHNNKEISSKVRGIGVNLRFLKSSYRTGENILNFALNFLRMDSSLGKEIEMVYGMDNKLKSNDFNNKNLDKINLEIKLEVNLKNDQLDNINLINNKIGNMDLIKAQIDNFNLIKYESERRNNKLDRGELNNSFNILNRGTVEFIEGNFSFIGDKINKLKEQYGYENRDFLILSNSKNSCDYIKLVSDFEVRKEMNFFKANNYKSLENHIVLTTYQCSKSFERKIVFLTNVDKIYAGKEATEKIKRKILYVGITRASEAIYICEGSSKKGKFFKELKLC